jgi:hypothetical protein
VVLAQTSDVPDLVAGDKDLTTLTAVLPPVLSPAAFLALPRAPIAGRLAIHFEAPQSLPVKLDTEASRRRQ